MVNNGDREDFIFEDNEEGDNIIKNLDIDLLKLIEFNLFERSIKISDGRKLLILIEIKKIMLDGINKELNEIEKNESWKYKK